MNYELAVVGLLLMLAMFGAGYYLGRLNGRAEIVLVLNDAIQKQKLWTQLKELSVGIVSGSLMLWHHKPPGEGSLLQAFGQVVTQAPLKGAGPAYAGMLLILVAGGARLIGIF